MNSFATFFGLYKFLFISILNLLLSLIQPFFEFSCVVGVVERGDWGIAFFDTHFKVIGGWSFYNEVYRLLLAKFDKVLETYGQEDELFVVDGSRNL